MTAHVILQLGFAFEILPANLAAQRDFGHILAHLMLLDVFVVGGFDPSAIAAKAVVRFLQRVGLDAMADVVGVLLDAAFPLVND